MSKFAKKVSPIRSIQRGTISDTSSGGESSKTATIVSVDTSKTIVNVTSQGEPSRLKLENSTRIKITFFTGGTTYMGYEVVEFN